MDGVACEEVAKQCIFAVRWAAANLIAWIEVANHNWHSFGLKKGLDLVAQKWPDVLELDIAGSIARSWIHFQQVLSRAFGDRDNGVRFFQHSLLERGEKTFELEWNLRNQGKVHVLTSHDCPGGDETGMAAHQFYQADSISYTA